MRRAGLPLRGIRPRLAPLLASLLLPVALPAAAPAQEAPTATEALDATEARIAAEVDARTGEAIAFLERAVNINSGTMHHEGVREAGRLFAAELEALGFRTRWIDQSAVDRAGHLFAERPAAAEVEDPPRLLLIGHLDTVFEGDSPFQRFERLDDSTATGPGVADMKGGDVVLLYALAALHAVGSLDRAQVTVALIGDEEDAGLPIATSRGDLIEAGRRADVALGFEGASGDGHRAVIARRGSGGWTLRVTGREGHSSRVFTEEYGSGAIFEAARILRGFHEEVRVEDDVTFNPGIVLGGTEVRYDEQRNRGDATGKTNVIARTVLVDGGLRFLTEAQKERARERMRAVVARHLPGTSAEVEFRDKYPAMPPTEGNRALLELLDDVSRSLGHGPVEPVEPGSRGAADISFVAPYVDGLDGLGPVGSGAHTTEERVDLRSLPVATRRAALLLHRLATRGPPPEVRPRMSDARDARTDANRGRESGRQNR